MKKIGMIMMVLILLASCVKTPPASSAVALNKESIVLEQEFVDYTKEENRDKIYENWRNGEEYLMKNPLFPQFYQDYWGFSNELFQKLAKEGNLIFSPLSAYIPLSELSYTMDDNCLPKEELIRLLRANSASPYWTKMLIDNFRASGYLIGSSMWISHQVDPDISFLKENLSSDIYRIDFADKDAPAQQMEWIHKWTNGFLKEQVKAEDFGDPSTPEKSLVCRLIGATYIKDAWNKEYFSDPKDGIFYAESGKEQKVPFLHSNDIKTIYQKQADYEMVRIPMREGYFTVILPAEGKTVNQLLQDNVLEAVSQVDNWEEVEAKVIMPDFTQSSRMEILPILKELGYTEIAEFQKGYEKLVGKNPDGSDAECAVTQILQESKIEVKKEGIQAASYTKVEVTKDEAVMIDQVKKVTVEVNRPYIYLITDRKNLPSFIGVNRELE
ncbi:hypothetical protein EII17_09250 [Clostridiales bacterium COT073_COT-073]|nr:hypothetical protein EII17_09250 [Clostridiales bacterium COT073_COT-073]